MRHPDSDSRLWGRIWFAKYALIYVFPLVVLFIPFRDHPMWLAILGLFWLCSVGFLAVRSIHGSVSLIWRVGLGLVMTGFFGFLLFAALIPEGDTKICYDRIHRTGIWGPLINLGPDPYCQGTPLQDVEID